MGLTKLTDEDRALEASLTRSIARVERECVLLAGQTFYPDLWEDDLRRIYARLLLLDARRDALVEDRASIRRKLWEVEE